MFHGKARYRFSAGTYVHRFMRDGQAWLRVKPARRDWYLIDASHRMHDDATKQEF